MEWTDKSDRVISPLTHSPDVMLERTISTSQLAEQYRRQLGIDVRSYFGEVQEISVYLCETSGYRFDHPLSIVGDARRYQALQRFPWYYLPWKWEHRAAFREIKPSDRVLEVGCGRGDFLLRLREKGAHCEGLELNPDALQAARQSGLLVTSRTVEEHASVCDGRYDVICAFQVLEHISAVREFLEGCIQLLKREGSLILSVPDNRSYIRHIPWDILNMPPHHQGLWDASSLSAIQKLFPLRLQRVSHQPLQAPYEIDKYYRALLGRLDSYHSFPFGYVSDITRRVPERYARRALRASRSLIRGDTLIAVYRCHP